MKKNLGFDAERYASLAGFESDWRDTWWHQDTLELMARRLRLDEVERALDVGCGGGHWGQRLSTLLPKGARVTGVDHEPGFLDAARARAERFEHAFDYVEGAAEALPFDDDTFDLVTCQTVLIHVADAERALREMIRVTRPGGLIVLAEPDNLFNALAYRRHEPQGTFEETLALIDFDRRCLEGKKALGQGDSALGDRLPHLLQALGLVDRRVYKNDRCASLLPPYDEPAERMTVEQLEAHADEAISSWGDEPTARALYLAGGGEADAFDGIWATEQRARRRMIEAVRAHRFRFTGGLSMYLAAGRKA